MQVTLSTVVVKGVAASIPAAGMPGRIYYATDIKRIYYDDGTAWTDVAPILAAVKVALAPSAAGNFTVAHGMAAAPSAVTFMKTSSGDFWLQLPTSIDATNLYLVASEAGITGYAICLP
jgi:subtilisin family serine protease